MQLVSSNMLRLVDSKVTNNSSNNNKNATMYGWYSGTMQITYQKVRFVVERNISKPLNG